jgi:hypothetical protein
MRRREVGGEAARMDTRAAVERREAPLPSVNGERNASQAFRRADCPSRGLASPWRLTQVGFTRLAHLNRADLG